MTVKPYYHARTVAKRHLEITPHARYNWKSLTSRDAWEPLLAEASQARTYAEWASVLDEDAPRKAAIIHIDNYNREEWMERISEHGLHYRAIRYSRPYRGYAHRFYPTDEHDLNRITYSVIAKDEETADLMREAELEMEEFERHDTVGKLLGFPECCRKSFYQNFVTGEIRDPMYEAACASPSAEMVDDDPNHVVVPDGNPGINPLYRYWNWAFITHIPCSLECEASIEVARHRYRVMVEGGYENGANALSEWLKAPAEWTGYHGLMEIRNSEMAGTALTSDYWSKKTIKWRGGHV